MRLKPYVPHTVRHLGFTLVELMIAIAISTILMLGVSQMFVVSRHSYNLDNGLARAQENARFAVHTMSEDIRMAGYIGCRANRIANTLNNTTNWMFDFDTPLHGWDGSATGTIPFPTEFASKAVAGTDAIVVLRGDNTQYKVVSSNSYSAQITLTSSAGLTQSDIVMVSDCDQASIFQITSTVSSNTITHSANSGTVTPGNCTKGLGSPVPSPCTAIGNNHDYKGTGSLMKMKATAYYIGTSTSGTGNALFSMSMDKGIAAPAVELAEGVEDMQILYGEDTDGDGLANRYVTADKVSDFKNIVSVRLGLLVDTTSNVLNASTTKSYKIAGSTAGPYTDKKLYFPITTTIKLRNRGVM